MRTRASIEADVLAYLAAGGKIVMVPMGVKGKAMPKGLPFHDDFKATEAAEILSAEFGLPIRREHVAMCSADSRRNKRGSGKGYRLTPRMAAVICRYLTSYGVRPRAEALELAARHRPLPV